MILVGADSFLTLTGLAAYLVLTCVLEELATQGMTRESITGTLVDEVEIFLEILHILRSLDHFLVLLMTVNILF